MGVETAVAVYVEVGHRDGRLAEETILSRGVESSKASHESSDQAPCRENALAMV